MSFWRNEFTPEEIAFVLDKIKPLRIFSSEGGVSIQGAGNLDTWVAFLASASGFKVKTDVLRTQIVKSVLFSPDLKVDFSEKDFREIAYRLRDKYQRQEIRVYKVVFPIWNNPNFLNGTKKIDDVTVNFSPSPRTKLFKTICREREKQRSDRYFAPVFTNERLNELRQCSVCFAHVRANSPADANERASEAIYEVLGLTNLAKDVGKHWRLSSRVSGKLPVSEVLIGPHTTTHFEDGTLTHGGFWRENWVGGPKRLSLNSQDMQAWEGRYDQLAEGFSRSPWRKQCKSAAVRYFKAFSNPDLEEAFLDGWRLFENISGSRHEKIEVKIIRVSNVFEENTGLRIIGKHLALRRNLISHGHPIKIKDEETLAFQMLQFILHYIELFIMNGFSFSSPEEFWEFLDLPASRDDRSTERDELRRRLSLLEKAAHFREETR